MHGCWSWTRRCEGVLEWKVRDGGMRCGGLEGLVAGFGQVAEVFVSSLSAACDTADGRGKVMAGACVGGWRGGAAVYGRVHILQPSGPCLLRSCNIHSILSRAACRCFIGLFTLETPQMLRTRHCRRGPPSARPCVSATCLAARLAGAPWRSPNHSATDVLQTPEFVWPWLGFYAYRPCIHRREGAARAASVGGAQTSPDSHPAGWGPIIVL